jgi:uncharacterized RDD family membrane protein YckC
MINAPLDQNSSLLAGASPAPLGRRIAAHLLDSVLGLLVIYLSTLPMAFAYDHGFGDLYAALCQSLVIGWAASKDAWWPGQSFGKRTARIVIADHRTGQRASRLHSGGRQAIFMALLVVVALAATLPFFQTAEFTRFAIISGVLSAVAPLRLLKIFLSSSVPLLKTANLSPLLSLGFILIEAFLVYTRPGRRRIVDLLAGTQVVDDRHPHLS